MSSSRRYSVQRHIDNANIHNGMGQTVPFVEYSVGRKEGRYQPKQVPPFSQKTTSIVQRLVDKIEVAVENQIAEVVAKRIVATIVSNPSNYSEIESLAKHKMRSKEVYHFIRDN